MYSILLALKVLKSYFDSKDQQHIYESVYNSLVEINFEDERTISEAILNITKNLENNQKLKKAFLCLIKSSIDFQRGHFEEDTTIKMPNACSELNSNNILDNEIIYNKKIFPKNCKNMKNQEDKNPQTSIILDKDPEENENNELTNKDLEMMGSKSKADANSVEKINIESNLTVEVLDKSHIKTDDVAKCDSNDEIIDILTPASNTVELPPCKNIEDSKKGNVINLKICKNKFLECSASNSLVRCLSRSYSMPSTSQEVRSNLSGEDNLTNNVTNSKDKSKINTKVIKYIKNVNQDKGNTKVLTNIDENKLIKLNKNILNNRLIDLPQSKNSILMKTNTISTKPLFPTKISLSTTLPQKKHILLFSKDMEKNNNFLSKYNTNMKINWTSKRQLTSDEKTEKSEEIKRKKGTPKDPDGSEDDLIIVDDENY